MGGRKKEDRGREGMGEWEVREGGEGRGEVREGGNDLVTERAKGVDSFIHRHLRLSSI